MGYSPGLAAAGARDMGYEIRDIWDLSPLYVHAPLRPSSNAPVASQACQRVGPESPRTGACDATLWGGWRVVACKHSALDAFRAREFVEFARIRANSRGAHLGADLPQLVVGKGWWCVMAQHMEAPHQPNGTAPAVTQARTPLHGRSCARFANS